MEEAARDLFASTGYLYRKVTLPLLTPGIVAGAMTQKNILGYVAAFPIPEVIRGINAFTLGARSVNPDAEVRVVWTKTWYDPATEKEAAKSLLDIGADVIAQHQDSPGPQEAAQEKGVLSVGYNSDMTPFAPKSHLTAPVWNWGPKYLDIAKQAGGIGGFGEDGDRGDDGEAEGISIHALLNGPAHCIHEVVVHLAGELADGGVQELFAEPG